MITLLVVSEVVVITHNKLFYAESADEVAVDKLLARKAAKGPIEGDNHNIIYARLLEQGALLVECREQSQPLVVAERDARMRLEGEHNALATARLGTTNNLVEQNAMPRVNSVVGAYRSHSIA